jgi:hypothetical protein
MADTGKTFSCSAQIEQTPLLNANECCQILHCHAAAGTVAVSRITGRKLTASKAFTGK